MLTFVDHMGIIQKIMLKYNKLYSSDQEVVMQNKLLLSHLQGLV